MATLASGPGAASAAARCPHLEARPPLPPVPCAAARPEEAGVCGRRVLSPRVGASAAAAALGLTVLAFVLYAGPRAAGAAALRGGAGGEAPAAAAGRQLRSHSGSQDVPEFAGAAFLKFGVLILCCGIQFCAYMRSRGKPFEVEEELKANGYLRYLQGSPFPGDKTDLTQQVKLVELCGYEAKNRYIAEDGGFFIDERSDCLQRVIASTNRELTLFGHAGPSAESPVVLRMYKPYHLQGCCCCRPQMVVDKPDGTPVGRVDDPFKCCCINQMVYDSYDMKKFEITGTICQCGAFCPLCADMTFEIGDQRGMAIGSIVKPQLSCEHCLKGANRFEIKYPPQATLDDKFLLVAAAMLLDLQYFEKNKNSN